MKEISSGFLDRYVPCKALLFYKYLTKSKSNDSRNEIYVEAFDIGKYGNPINAHPLSLEEMRIFSKLLASCNDLKTNIFQSKGMIPENVLYVDHSENGSVIWHTAAKDVQLFFVKALGIKNGKGKVPPLLWKASKYELKVFALKTDDKPNLKTPLYHAPFFNMYETGKVCMGNVEVKFLPLAYLEDFIVQWESYFWNSYFGHLLESFNPISVDMVRLWQTQIKTKKAFPVEVLKETTIKLKNLMS